NDSAMNALYESLYVLPYSGRQLVKTSDGYTLILGMKDGLDSANNVNGHNDDVSLFIRNAGYGQDNAIGDEIQEILQRNPITFYVSLNGKDYGPKFSDITKEILELNIEDVELSEQAVDDIVNLMSHLSFSVNSQAEMEFVLALDNTEDNPLITIWQTMERLEKELGMLD
ncbi:MAG: hypothetical protein VX611_04870, partial [Bacteroidota bacterium]|nr:hypothetical protein [Bacteroidota bacterium]